MLRLPPFQVFQPGTVEEAVALRTEHDALYLAGGTDLLVNLKHRLQAPAALIDLGGIEGLTGVREVDGALEIGARTSLHDLAVHPGLPEGLVQALSVIAGPQHRRMGTIGGNVLLDTRCLYVNQSEPWRQALGRCLKADGDWCHVIGSSKACVAAQSSDSVPMLTALGATLVFATSEGLLERPLQGLFTKDGRYDRMLSVPRSALLTTIRLPHPGPQRSVYRKVRHREAVDFPVVSVAAAADFDGPVATSLSIVLGAMLPAPRVLGRLDRALGVPWTDALLDDLADQAFRSARPQTSIAGDVRWRRHLIRVETRRALQVLRP